VCGCVWRSQKSRVQTSRFLPDSSFKTYFGRVVFHNYGHRNTSPVTGGVAYGNYLATHNVNPSDNPKTERHVRVRVRCSTFAASVADHVCACVALTEADSVATSRTRSNPREAQRSLHLPWCVLSLPHGSERADVDMHVFAA